MESFILFLVMGKPSWVYHELMTEIESLEKMPLLKPLEKNNAETLYDEISRKYKEMVFSVSREVIISGDNGSIEKHVSAEDLLTEELLSKYDEMCTGAKEIT